MSYAGLSRKGYALAEQYADYIADVLLAEGETFRRMDLPDDDWVVQPFRELAEADCLEAVNSEFYSTGSTYLVYTVRDGTAEVARETVAARDPMCPCGHSGLANHGDRFSCQFPGCDETFARDEIDGGGRSD